MKIKSKTAKALADYSNRHLGEVVVAKDIIDEVSWVNRLAPEGILPADFVFNPPKARKTDTRKYGFFYKLDRGLYFCVGYNPSFKDRLKFVFKKHN